MRRMITEKELKIRDFKSEAQSVDVALEVPSDFINTGVRLDPKTLYLINIYDENSDNGASMILFPDWSMLDYGSISTINDMKIQAFYNGDDDELTILATEIGKQFQPSPYTITIYPILIWKD